ncbi:uncharacterized protein LOC129292170 isoform X1 [Prosopis cineraria]|uniref:uncharacterized protein LOC129292170 isoform X1 n=1 Tax=Prosopis cineraria TaxID=364024 RepID=UPI0024101797|nr:uncharacterized protein LOC129292170 isoform X1 [Prosopis cineraria]
MNSGSGSEAKMESNKETQQKSDSFVIEMEAFSPANINKDSNSNSRITVQRSVSRKGWGDKKVNVAAAAIRDWDAIPAACSPSSKGCCVAGMPERSGLRWWGPAIIVTAHGFITISPSSRRPPVMKPKA